MKVWTKIVNELSRQSGYLTKIASGESLLDKMKKQMYPSRLMDPNKILAA